ncbi:MAG: penicillin-binding protein [Lachnospiraceae bacterium]|nr:penicillin-binding protein [Lachnospiraceae bacterium]
MFEQLRDKVIGVITSRLFFLLVVVVVLFSVLTVRLFNLQIIEGESFLDNFTLKIEREKTIKSTRGSIFDRNGNFLAKDKLAYSVTIEDNYDSGSKKNMEINNTIVSLMDIIERNGDKFVNDFFIILDDSGDFIFTLEGTRQLRFLADIYGRNSTEDLKAREKNSTPDEIIDYLCSEKKFGIGTYTKNDDGSYDFTPKEGFSNEDLLKIITVRYNLSLNSYQKYISTTVATNVNDKTVAEIMEHKDSLQGVNISEDTIREYIDDPSFSHILGYTGKISEEELIEFNKQSDIDTSVDARNYELNDYVGKAGIEQVMERKLQGKKGRQTIFVDNLGRVTETGDKTDPVAGNDLYLTIDSDLQKAVYQILEQKIAGIVVSKIVDEKPMDNADVVSSEITIPIDNVYYALFDNNFFSLEHLSSENAGPNEREVNAAIAAKKAAVIEKLREELLNGALAYNDLVLEDQSYEAYAVTFLQSPKRLIFNKDLIDQDNEMYLKWKDGSCSLREYLLEAVAEGWIDSAKIGSEKKYMDSDEVYRNLIDYLLSELVNDTVFSKRIIKYMIRQDEITGYQICHMLYEQGKIRDVGNNLAELDNGSVTPFRFMVNRIKALEITPADLALDPCSGSSVVTDANTGEVLACVSYPSYDNSKLANTVDAEYFASLQSDKSLPLYDYATQQKTAPGSTFKPISSAAGLEEGVINVGETIDCEGIFEKITPSPRCWIYPSSTHGSLEITGAIQNSCNFFFYEVGYRLASRGGIYNNDYGIARLTKYVDLFGLTEKSGIEITESEPNVSTQDAVRSAIGQGNHSYTTVALARYVNAVANESRCYSLSLLDKLTDANGNMITDYSPGVRNEINIASSTWNSIHDGMRKAVENYGAFEEFPMTAGGKTGTAQQITTRPNHALFIGFAPYNRPEIAVCTRIAYGYTSSNAAEVTRDVFRYYFKIADKDDIIKGEAVLPDSAAISD